MSRRDHARLDVWWCVWTTTEDCGQLPLTTETGWLGCSTVATYAGGRLDWGAMLTDDDPKGETDAEFLERRSQELIERYEPGQRFPTRQGWAEYLGISRQTYATILRSGSVSRDRKTRAKIEDKVGRLPSSSAGVSDGAPAGDASERLARIEALLEEIRARLPEEAAGPRVRGARLGLRGVEEASRAAGDPNASSPQPPRPRTPGRSPRARQDW